MPSDLYIFDGSKLVLLDADNEAVGSLSTVAANNAVRFVTEGPLSLGALDAQPIYIGGSDWRFGMALTSTGSTTYTAKGIGLTYRKETYYDVDVLAHYLKAYPSAYHLWWRYSLAHRVVMPYRYVTSLVTGIPNNSAPYWGHNILVNALERYNVTWENIVNTPYWDYLFDGCFKTTGVRWPSDNPAVITIEGLPHWNTQANGWIGWATRGYHPVDFKIEYYDYHDDTWKTLVNVTDYPFYSYAVNAYDKYIGALRFIFYTASYQYDNGDYIAQFSELFFIHPEAARVSHNGRLPDNIWAVGDKMALGTQAPTDTLDIATGGLAVPAGTASAPAIHARTTDGGFYFDDGYPAIAKDGKAQIKFGTEADTGVYFQKATGVGLQFNTGYGVSGTTDGLMVVIGKGLRVHSAVDAVHIDFEANRESVLRGVIDGAQEGTLTFAKGVLQLAQSKASLTLTGTALTLEAGNPNMRLTGNTTWRFGVVEGNHNYLGLAVGTEPDGALTTQYYIFDNFGRVYFTGGGVDDFSNYDARLNLITTAANTKLLHLEAPMGGTYAGAKILALTNPNGDTCYSIDANAHVALAKNPGNTEDHAYEASLTYTGDAYGAAGLRVFAKALHTPATAVPAGTAVGVAVTLQQNANVPGWLALTATDYTAAANSTTNIAHYYANHDRDNHAGTAYGLYVTAKGTTGTVYGVYADGVDANYLEGVTKLKNSGLALCVGDGTHWLQLGYDGTYGTIAYDGATVMQANSTPAVGFGQPPGAARVSVKGNSQLTGLYVDGTYNTFAQKGAPVNTNPDFDHDLSGWEGNGWSWGEGGCAVHSDPDATDPLQQTVNLVAGQRYYVAVYIKRAAENPTGYVTIKLGDVYCKYAGSTSAWGTTIYRFTFAPQANGAYVFAITPQAGFNGRIAYARVQPVSPVQPAVSLGGFGLRYRDGYYSFIAGNASATYLTYGIYNVFIGDKVLDAVVAGHYNVVIGMDAMRGKNNSPYYNVAIGYGVLKEADGPCYTVALGAQAFRYATEAHRTVGIGYDAFYKMASVRRSVGVGYQTAYGVSGATSYHDVFVGFRAGYLLSTSERNVLIGAYAHDVGGTVKYTVSIGYSAGYYLRRSTSNVFIGYQAGYGYNSGDVETKYNVAVGSVTGYLLDGAYGNVLLGYAAGHHLTNGQHNVFIGFQAGYRETGSYKYYLATDSDDYILQYGDFSSGLLQLGGRNAKTTPTLRLEAGNAYFANEVHATKYYEDGTALANLYAAIDHTHALSDLSDVVIKNLVNGDCLVYDSIDKIWRNTTLTLDSLDDVALEYPSDGDVLYYNNGFWANSKLTWGLVIDKPFETLGDEFANTSGVLSVANISVKKVAIDGDIVPQASKTYNLGAPDYYFAEAYINTLNTGGASSAAGVLKVGADASGISIGADGVIQIAVNGSAALPAIAITTNGDVAGFYKIVTGRVAFVPTKGYIAREDEVVDSQGSVRRNRYYGTGNTESTPHIAHNDDLDTGILFKPADQTITLVAAGSRRVTATDEGVYLYLGQVNTDDLPIKSVNVYLDENQNRLVFAVKYTDGTVKKATLDLA